MVWELVAYDTELRQARSRSFTRSARTAELWEQIPRVDFTDSGHGIVFNARPHSAGRPRGPVIPHSEHAQKHLARLQREQR